MNGDDTIALTVALSIWVGVVLLLWQRFTSAGIGRADALSAAVALALGLTLTVLGSLHAISVAPFPGWNDEPYDTRRVWLLTIGLILVHTGVMNAALYRRIKQAERWALVGATATTSMLVLFLLILHPAQGQTVLIVMSGGYLVLLLWRLQATHERSLSD